MHKLLVLYKSVLGYTFVKNTSQPVDKHFRYHFIQYIAKSDRSLIPFIIIKDSIVSLGIGMRIGQTDL